MTYNLKKEIISKLIQYGQNGCSVNDLFRNLECGRNDFINMKDQLVKQGIIKPTKEGKQKTILTLDPEFFAKMDMVFYQNVKRHEEHASDALIQLRRVRTLFKHTKDTEEPSEIQVTNQRVSMLLQKIIDSLEAIAHYTMVFTFRYHIESTTKKPDLKKNQKHGFETIQKIIEKLILQHKKEEKELRNYLLWGTSSSFSYVVG